MKAYEIKKNIN